MQTNEYHEINHYNDLSFPVELYRGNQFGTIPFGRAFAISTGMTRCSLPLHSTPM